MPRFVSSLFSVRLTTRGTGVKSGDPVRIINKYVVPTGHRNCHLLTTMKPVKMTEVIKFLNSWYEIIILIFPVERKV